eukprot:s2761_g15.t1
MEAIGSTQRILLRWVPFCQRKITGPTLQVSDSDLLVTIAGEAALFAEPRKLRSPFANHGERRFTSISVGCRVIWR